MGVQSKRRFQFLVSGRVEALIDQLWLRWMRHLKRKGGQENFN